MRSEDIWKFIRAKDKRNNDENQCQCTCDECGAECEPFWKKEKPMNEIEKMQQVKGILE